MLTMSLLRRRRTLPALRRYQAADHD